MSLSLSLRVGAVAGVALAGGLLAAGPAAAAASSQDSAWIVSAHQSNLAEIAAGQAAQTGATTSAVKSLGQMFITDHTTLDASLKTLAASKGVTLPTTPNAQQQASLAQVETQSGQAFDSAWIAAQLTGHAQAAAAGNQELATGSDPQVLAADRAAAPVVAHHYAELTADAAQFGVPLSVSAGTGGQAAHKPGSAAAGTGVAAGGAVLVLGAGGLAWRRRRAASAA